MPTPLLLVSVEAMQALIERTVKASEARIVARVLDELRTQGVITMDAIGQVRDEQAKQAAILSSMGDSLAEVSADLDVLLEKLASGTPDSDEVNAALGGAQELTNRLSAFSAALKTAAAKFTFTPNPGTAAPDSGEGTDASPA